MAVDGPHVVLVGMMGSGKSTVGRRLARRWGWRFVDSDTQVEAVTGRTVRQIFEEDGEASFRAEESAALAAALADRTPAVVAAAGGVVLDPGNRQRLRAAGVVVWLTAAPEVLAERATRSGGGHRPLLAEDPVGAMQRLADERASLYADVADHVVDVGALAPDEVVERIAALV
jgi:shikimate kinase